MNIGFVVNQIETEEAWYDTTLLTSTAAQMGHTVYIIAAGDLAYYEKGHMGGQAVKAPKKKFKTPRRLLKTYSGAGGGNCKTYF